MYRAVFTIFILNILSRAYKHDSLTSCACAAAAHILKGFFLALAMSASSFLTTILLNQYFHVLYRLGLHIKAELVTMLYNKALNLTSASKAEHGTGAIVNLQSNDASKLWRLPQFLHILWSGPFQILTTMALLVRIIGWPGAFAGLGVTFALIPLNTFAGKKVNQYRKVQMKVTDQRVKLTTEVITGVEAVCTLVKYANWGSRVVQSVLSNGSPHCVFGPFCWVLFAVRRALASSRFNWFVWTWMQDLEMHRLEMIQ